MILTTTYTNLVYPHKKKTVLDKTTVDCKKVGDFTKKTKSCEK